MKFYEIPDTKCRMHIPVYSMGTKVTRLKAAVHYAAYSLSRGNLKNLMPRSFTFVCPLYCCSSKHNNNIAMNFCETVSTSSMALATVKKQSKVVKKTGEGRGLIKATLASSYVYASCIPIYCLTFCEAAFPVSFDRDQ